MSSHRAQLARPARLPGLPPLSGRAGGAALRDLQGPLSVAYQFARAAGACPADAARAAGVDLREPSARDIDRLPEMRAAIARRRAALQAAALDSVINLAPGLAARAEQVLARLELLLDDPASAPAAVRAITSALTDLCRELARLAGIGEDRAADLAAVRAEVERVLTGRLVAAVRAAAPAAAPQVVRLIAAEFETCPEQGPDFTQDAPPLAVAPGPISPERSSRSAFAAAFSGPFNRNITSPLLLPSPLDRSRTAAESEQPTAESAE